MASITDNITVQGAPEIPGLTFRRFRGEEDYQVLLDVNTGSKIADGMEHDLHTLDTLKHTYGSSPNHDPSKDVLIAEVDGKAVAFNRIWMQRELDGTRIYFHFGFVLPEWRGKGIGRAMIGWSENRAREREDQESGEGTALLGTSVDTGQDALENLLKHDGYEPVRYGFHMETPDLDHIPDVPMPEGLEIRPAKPEHYRAIYDASFEAFRDHWGATEDEYDFDSFINDPMNEPGLWVVAWDGDEVAGSILNFINHDYNARAGRKLGYTEAISVRRPWRRRGLARAMLAQSMRLHKAAGMTQTGLGVDTQNLSGALNLYESMGYKVVAKFTEYRKPLPDGAVPGKGQ